MRSRTIALLLGLLGSIAIGPAEATVFYSRSEALQLAFPSAERIDSETYILSDQEAQQIETLSKSPVDSKLVKIYTGFHGDAVIGHAIIDIHNVRTLPEAFIIVLTPSGAVRSLRVLAFHEPLEYLPPKRWYQQFGAKSLEEPLRLGRDVHGIAGSTLSARATTRGVRRALALYEVLLQNGKY